MIVIGMAASSARQEQTVTSALPFLPSTLAVIVALPLATAVTRPASDPVAIVEGALDQVTVFPVRAVPAAGLGVATKRTVSPGTAEAVGGERSTVATPLAGGVGEGSVPPPPQAARTRLQSEQTLSRAQCSEGFRDRR